MYSLRHFMLAVAEANSTGGGGIQLVDAHSLATIGSISREADITQLASALDYSDNKVTISGTRLFDMETFIGYSFAGWFSSPQPLDTQVAEANKITSLADAPDTIYAQWINAGYLKPTIAYYSNDTRAPAIYSIFTTPDDIFQAYGWLYYYGRGNPIEDQFTAGNQIDGSTVRDVSISNLYRTISNEPFSASDPKTANDFNGNLGGAYDNGTNGRLCYTRIGNITVGTTVRFRPYCITKDGTTVYGDIRSKTLLANTTDTGLEEAATEPVTPPTVDM